MAICCMFLESDSNEINVIKIDDIPEEKRQDNKKIFENRCSFVVTDTKLVELRAASITSANLVPVSTSDKEGNNKI